MKVLLFLLSLALAVYCMGMAAMLGKNKRKCGSCRYIYKCWKKVDDIARTRDACENYEEDK